MCYTVFGIEKKAGEGMAKADASGMNNAAGVAYGDLIRKYRKQAGMNQEELGALARVHKNAVGAWEAGRSRPDLGSVPRICEALGLTLNEFFGTQAAPESKNESEAFISRFEQLTADHRRVVLREMDLLLALQEKRTAPRPLVKVYRNELSACAGPGLGIGEAAGEEVWLYADTLPGKADEIIRVSGDSMEPTYRDGQQVFVRHTGSLREGEIGIFVVGDMGYIKEYSKEGLVSHNPAYPLMRFSGDEEVRCIGKVIGVLDGSQIADEADIELFLNK